MNRMRLIEGLMVVVAVVPGCLAGPEDADGERVAEATLAVIAADRECVLNGEAVGVCGADSLLHACDGTWTNACSQLDGHPTRCSQPGCEHRVVLCSDDDLTLPCDSAFTSNCQHLGGIMHWADQTGRLGACEVDPIPVSPYMTCHINFPAGTSHCECTQGPQSDGCKYLLNHCESGLVCEGTHTGGLHCTCQVISVD